MKAALSLIFTGFSITCFCQSFISENKLWSYVAHGSEYGSPYRSYYVKISGDSLVKDIAYKKLLKSTDENHDNWFFRGLIRETDTGTVYFLEVGEESERTLFDFGVDEGDSIRIGGYQSYLYVDSIRYKPFGIYNEHRKRIYLSSTYTGTVGSWIEGMGSVYGLPLDPDFYGSVGEYRSILCYHENDSLKYVSNTFQTCYKTGFYDVRIFDHWPKVGTRWHYSKLVSPLWNPIGTVVRVTCVGDTVIDSENMRVLVVEEKPDYTYWQKVDTIYIAVKGDQVYHQIEHRLGLLYDFGVQAGDTVAYDLTTEASNNYSDTVLEMKVDSIKYLPIEGYQLKTIYQSQIDPFAEYYSNYDVVRERLGGHEYLLPIPVSMAADVGGITGIRCYADLEIDYRYGTFEYYPCDTTFFTSIEEKGESVIQVIVYPNPATNSLTIVFENQDFRTKRLSIYDNLGRLATSFKDINGDQIEVDVSQYEPGIYFYRLLSEDNRFGYTGKFIVKD
jgi:hypothetical protein